MRAMLLRVVREDYVSAAKARGLPERLITRRYILKPSLAPVLTNVILALAGSLGGMIITESVFNWPGMGTLYYAAITEGDSSTIAALSTIYIGIYMIARFILEVLYIIVDPRIRAK
jgi:peptide/nickel transport system permease protein